MRCAIHPAFLTTICVSEITAFVIFVSHTGESGSMVARLLCCVVRVHLLNQVFCLVKPIFAKQRTSQLFFFADIVNKKLS